MTYRARLSARASTVRAHLPTLPRPMVSMMAAFSLTGMRMLSVSVGSSVIRGRPGVFLAGGFMGAL